MANIGDWVSPQWTGHAYYGQTGQIIGDATNPSGVEYWLIDVNGDGSHDYTVNKGANKFTQPSSIHQGYLSDSVTGLADKGAQVLDLIVPVTLSVLALGIFICFVKKLRKR